MKVVDGKDETFELTAAEEGELLESIAEIERGDFITGEKLLKRLALIDRRFQGAPRGRQR